MLIFLSICVFSLFSFHFGNASHECPVPAKRSHIYLHMEQLNALALEQGYQDTVQTPLLCLKGHDEDCTGQKCCPGEVGCCLSDRKNERHVRECGCKEANSKICQFPPPYAVLAESKCTANGTTTITTCLREIRVVQYLPNKPGIKANTKASRQDSVDPGAVQGDIGEVVGHLLETGGSIGDEIPDTLGKVELPLEGK